MPLTRLRIQCFSLFLAAFVALGAIPACAQGGQVLEAEQQSAASPETAGQGGQEGAQGAARFSVTGLPIPRFVSLASDVVYMRSGPGTKYPVLWEYSRKGLPVEITMEFDIWRKIRDSEGAEGWVHKSLLSGRRSVIVQGEGTLEVKRRPKDDARLMAYLEPGAIATVDACEGDWCAVSAQGYKGWAQRKFLWGVYPEEEFN